MASVDNINIPTDATSEVQGYAENMIDSVLMPVADGAKHLGVDDQVAALATVVDGICRTWSDHFLKHKIRIR